MIVGDCLIYVFIHVLSLNPITDQYLFFFVPLLTATIFLETSTFRIGLTIALCYLGAVTLTYIYAYPIFGEETMVVSVTFIQAVIFRALSFFVASCALGFLTHSLDASRNQYADLLENLQVVIWTKDSKGRFTYVSHNFPSLVGMERRDQIIGKTDFDLFPKNPEFARAVRADDKWVIENEKKLVRQNEEFPTIDGRDCYNLVVKVPLRRSQKGRDGYVLETQGFLIDVTEQIIRMKEAAELGIVAKTAKDIRHSILNCKSIISANIEALGLFAGPGTEGEKYLVHLSTFWDRLVHEIDQVGSSDAPYHAEFCSVSEIMETVWLNVRHQWGLTYRPRLGDPGEYTARIDKYKFMNAVENLFINAVEAGMGSVGELIRGKEHGFRVSIERDVGGYRVEVANSGKVTVETKRKLREGLSFTTKSDDGSNHGLGLGSVRKFVEKNGGTLDYRFTSDTVTAVLLVKPNLHNVKSIQEIS